MIDLVMVVVFALEAAELLALPPVQGRPALQATAFVLLFYYVCHSSVVCVFDRGLFFLDRGFSLEC